MIDGIEGITTKALSLALDAASLRQQAIASNIANANSEGYMPQRVNFEAFVQEAKLALNEHGQLDSQTLRNMMESPLTIEPVLGGAGLPAKVQLDGEVAGMAQNAVHYQALLKGLSRHLAVLYSAASDGKH
jgi:flagellar basal-body rod protein FlgB